nr:C1 family peptidase [Lacticaseibacillus camelliae]
MAKAVQNVGPQAASRGTLNDKAIKLAFSIELDTGKVTNQKQSGRCWMFSELNTMRHFAGEKFGIKDLELSQAYLPFTTALKSPTCFSNRSSRTPPRPRLRTANWRPCSSSLTVTAVSSTTPRR